MLMIFDLISGELLARQQTSLGYSESIEEIVPDRNSRVKAVAGDQCLQQAYKCMCLMIVHDTQKSQAILKHVRASDLPWRRAEALP